MISFEDCIALCGLTEVEVAAIAEHEHLPEVAAAVLGQYLLHQRDGLDRVRDMIVGDMRGALKSGDSRHARVVGGSATPAGDIWGNFQTGEMLCLRRCSSGPEKRWSQSPQFC